MAENWRKETLFMRKLLGALMGLFHEMKIVVYWVRLLEGSYAGYLKGVEAFQESLLLMQ